MAIHPNFPGLSAEVVVDSNPLMEYRDEDNKAGEQSDAITKYVQVTSDTNFGVCYTIPKGLHGARGVRSNLKVDGKSVRSYNHSHAQLAKHNVTNCIDTVSSTIGGSNYTQRLRFSQLHTDEEGEGLDEDMMQQLKHTGTLILRLTFINDIVKRDLKHGTQQTIGIEQERLPVLDGLTEKCLKGDAKSHQASLDAPVLQGAYVPCHTENIYKMGKPFAIFHFKYRSAAALKMLHVIPRTPSPSPWPLREHANSGKRGEESKAITRASSVKSEAVSQTVRQEMTKDAKREGKQDIKRERRQGIKREANVIYAEGEVEFVSSKRVKTLPTRKDEVIVLD